MKPIAGISDAPVENCRSLESLLAPTVNKNTTHFKVKTTLRFDKSLLVYGKSGDAADLHNYPSCASKNERTEKEKNTSQDTT